MLFRSTSFSIVPFCSPFFSVLNFLFLAGCRLPFCSMPAADLLFLLLAGYRLSFLFLAGYRLSFFVPCRLPAFFFCYLPAASLLFLSLASCRLRRTSPRKFQSLPANNRKKSPLQYSYCKGRFNSLNAVPPLLQPVRIRKAATFICR